MQDPPPDGGAAPSAIAQARYLLRRGAAEPLGAVAVPGGTQIAFVAPEALGARLDIYAPGQAATAAQLTLDPLLHRTGDVWHARIDNLHHPFEYTVSLEPDTETPLIDLQAQLLTRHGSTWRAASTADFPRGLEAKTTRPRTPWRDSIVYELHVRGFTRHQSAGATHAGTYRGLLEKIDHLRALGVTALELMPIAEFDDSQAPARPPPGGAPLQNYWGYDPVSFLALRRAYAADPTGSAPLVEFREVVHALHTAGIEVILDVVFNHTGEGRAGAPPHAWRGYGDQLYYLHNPQTGKPIDVTGCGNTVNANHPIVADHILAALRRWVIDFDVDGFRFDIASVLARGQDGALLDSPPLIERIAKDPILASTKLIAEPWDAGGAYQVGSFPHFERWAEWNGLFRDDVRKFVKGDAGAAGALAQRLLGSADLYQDRTPECSINFTTCHDGFTLRDLVSYNTKHNQANGEENRDGNDANYSWNCGVEGPTDDPTIRELRRRQMKNLQTLLLVSHGVPMLLAGDELGRTQGGNNNPYCQDNETSWLDWTLDEEARELLAFTQKLISFRKQYSILRESRFVADTATCGTQVSWHGIQPHEPDWSDESRSLAMHLWNADTGEELYICASAFWEALRFELPAPTVRAHWYRVIDTAERPPHDFASPDAATRLRAHELHVAPRAVVVLVGDA